MDDVQPWRAWPRGLVARVEVTVRVDSKNVLVGALGGGDRLPAALSARVPFDAALATLLGRHKAGGGAKAKAYTKEPEVFLATAKPARTLRDVVDRVGQYLGVPQQLGAIVERVLAGETGREQLQHEQRRILLRVPLWHERARALLAGRGRRRARAPSGRRSRG